MTSFPITAPTSPGFTKISFGLTPCAAISQSQFSKATQAYDYNGDAWEGVLSFPRMSESQAKAWQAFLAKLRGVSGTFLIGKLTVANSGTATGAVNNGGTAVRSKSMIVDGMGNAKTLLAGDHFQVGNRLHMITDDATSDGSGNATLYFEPGLREAVADNTALTLSNPKCVFRLLNNKNQWTLDQLQAVGIPDLQIMEAIP